MNYGWEYFNLDCLPSHAGRIAPPRFANVHPLVKGMAAYSPFAEVSQLQLRP